MWVSGAVDALGFSKQVHVYRVEAIETQSDRLARVSPIYMPVFFSRRMSVVPISMGTQLKPPVQSTA